MSDARSLTRSSLGRLQGRTPSNDDDIDAKKAAAWHHQGFYGERVDEITDDDWFKQTMINRASRKFGKRTSTAQDVKYGSR